VTFREVSVTQVKEALRRWLRNDVAVRAIAVGADIDCKTARRYIEAAVSPGLDRAAGKNQLTEALTGAVCEAVRPSRPHGHGASWQLLSTEEETSGSEGSCCFAPLHDLFPVTVDPVDIRERAREIGVLHDLNPVSVGITDPGEQAPVQQAQSAKAVLSASSNKSLVNLPCVMHDNCNVGESPPPRWGRARRASVFPHEELRSSDPEPIDGPLCAQPLY